MKKQTQQRQTGTRGTAKRENVDEEEVRERAYQLYQDRMRKGQDGSPEDDWRRAEAIVAQETQPAATAR